MPRTSSFQEQVQNQFEISLDFSRFVAVFIILLLLIAKSRD